MRAVAEWLAGGLFTAAQPMGSRLLSREDQRLDVRRRMGAIAERLIGATPAPAPGIFFACF